MNCFAASANFLPKSVPFSNYLHHNPKIGRWHPSPLRSCRTIPIRNPRFPKLLFAVFAESSNGLNGDVNEGGGDDLKGGSRRPPALNVRWRDLLDPDPENIVAVGLTGLLTWASVQVLWQLFYISIAILLAALKYSFIAALLLFILVTLL